MFVCSIGKKWYHWLTVHCMTIKKKSTATEADGGQEVVFYTGRNYHKLSRCQWFVVLTAAKIRDKPRNHEELLLSTKCYTSQGAETSSV